MKNTVKKINIKSTKAIALNQPGKITYFCRAAARLYGKIALREQFHFDESVGVPSSFEMVELDINGLNAEIRNLSKTVAKSIVLLNITAKSLDLRPVLYGAEEMSLSEIVESVLMYVEELVSDSDYQTLL